MDLRQHLIGLDLGQAGDPSALCVLDRREAMPPPYGVVAGPMPPTSYECVYLRRWPLGTTYPAIVEDALKIVTDPRLVDPLLVVDRTGVGRAVVDLFLAQSRAPLVGVTITGGAAAARKDATGAGGYCVPKKDLVSTLQVLLGHKRLLIAAGLKDASLLAKELQNFKVKITAAANEAFGCFVAGTMVETSAGPKPIECVKRGDDVLTRDGYKEVVWAGESKRVNITCRVLFSGGVTVEGTPDHLVMTRHRGWVELGQLTCHDQCILTMQTGARVETQKRSSSTVSSIGSRPVANTTIAAGRASRCIETCGRIILGRSRMGTTSTIKTATPRITLSRTSNASVMPHTLKSTSNEDRQSGSGARRVKRSLYAAALGGPNSKIHGRIIAPFGASIAPAPKRSMSVSGAHANSSLAAGSFGFVRPCAARLIATKTGLAESSPAGNAASTFLPSTKCHSFVRVAAPPEIVSSGTPRPVYDLSIDGLPEFFANGILVHNSWREGAHDDLVLALAVACWVGEHVCAGPLTAPSKHAGRHHNRTLMSAAPAGVFASTDDEDNDEDSDGDEEKGEGGSGGGRLAPGF